MLLQSLPSDDWMDQEVGFVSVVVVVVIVVVVVVAVVVVQLVVVDAGPDGITTKPTY